MKKVMKLLKTYVIGRQLIPVVLCLCITSILTFLRPLIIKGITDQGFLRSDLHMICIFAVFLLFSTCADQFAEIMQCRKFADIQNHMIHDLYMKSFDKILHLKQSYFTGHNSAEMINRITTDILTVSLIADRTVLFAVSYILSIIAGMFGLFLLNWKLALLVIAIVPFKVLLSIKMSRLNENAVSEKINLMRSFSSWFGDTINGIKEIKLWNLQREKAKSLSDQQDDILKAEKRSTLYSAYNQMSTLLLSAMVQCALYICGGILYLRGELTLGGVTAFIAYCGYVITPIASLLSIRYMFSGIRPSLNRLNEFFRLPEEPARIGAAPDLPNSGPISALTLRHIQFSHTAEDLLTDVNLTVHAGEKVAIIGNNGSGKSTLMDLILQFEKPVSGEIRMNGRNVLSYSKESYYDLFAVVDQEPHFFQDSVRKNLDPGERCSDSEIRDVFMKCGMQHFLEDRLHGDFNQTVRFDAGDFSGGERKKLAVARAILKNTPIIIMDEAAADYDYEAEQRLSHLLADAFPDKMILYITHNYSYLDLFDRVYRLSDGRLYSLTEAEIESLTRCEREGPRPGEKAQVSG
jgi:ATP-binding cassette subfamily B protein